MLVLKNADLQNNRSEKYKNENGKNKEPRYKNEAHIEFLKIAIFLLFLVFL